MRMRTRTRKMAMRAGSRAYGEDHRKGGGPDEADPEQDNFRTTRMRRTRRRMGRMSHAGWRRSRRKMMMTRTRKIATIAATTTTTTDDEKAEEESEDDNEAVADGGHDRK